MRIVVIGGGAAGATAAQFARKQSRDAEIIVFESTPYPQYSKCGLPYVLSGEIDSFDRLIEFSEEWFQRNKIDLRLSTEVRNVDLNSRMIEFSAKSTEEKISYDSLIIATGATPSMPKIDGISKDGQLLKGIFQFRDIHEAKKLKEWCDAEKRSVLVVGAGLVGLEVAEALHKKRHEVSIAEFLDSILPTMIDPDMAEPLSNAITGTGIKLSISSIVQSIAEKDGKFQAKIISRKEDSAETVEFDTIVIATGQRPENAIAKHIGCELGKTGHIKVKKRCETSVNGVYAVGDCTQYSDAVTGVEWPVGLGTLAVKMGEIAGKNSAGGDASLPDGFLNSRVTNLFGLEVAGVGPLSSALTDADQKYIQARVKGSSLPAYYPGGKEIIAKLIVSSEDGRILACQMVGETGAGLRIDIIAAMIMGKLKVDDLSMLETAYAPSVAPCVDVLTTAAQAIMIKMERMKKT